MGKEDQNLWRRNGAESDVRGCVSSPDQHSWRKTVQDIGDTQGTFLE